MSKMSNRTLSIDNHCDRLTVLHSTHEISSPCTYSYSFQDRTKPNYLRTYSQLTRTSI